jgi:hypothetical protein
VRGVQRSFVRVQRNPCLTRIVASSHFGRRSQWAMWLHRDNPSPQRGKVWLMSLFGPLPEGEGGGRACLRGAPAFPATPPRILGQLNSRNAVSSRVDPSRIHLCLLPSAFCHQRPKRRPHHRTSRGYQGTSVTSLGANVSRNVQTWSMSNFGSRDWMTRKNLSREAWSKRGRLKTGW